MIDGVGNVSSVLVIGAANPLCLATVDRLVGPRLSRAVAMDSDAVGLMRGAQRIRDFGVPQVTELSYSVGDSASQKQSIDEAFAVGDVDVVIIGPSPHRQQLDPDAPAASDTVTYLRHTLIDIVGLAELAGSALSSQGHGLLTLFTHEPARIKSGLDADYCAAMAALHVLAPGLSAAVASGGGRTVCAAIDPARDPNSSRAAGGRAATMSPLDVASELAPVITSRRKRRPAFEIVHLPKTLRASAGRITARR